MVFQKEPMHLWSDENLTNVRQEEKVMKKDIWMPDRYDFYKKKNIDAGQYIMHKSLMVQFDAISYF